MNRNANAMMRNIKTLDTPTIDGFKCYICNDLVIYNHFVSHMYSYHHLHLGRYGYQYKQRVLR